MSDPTLDRSLIIYQGIEEQLRSVNGLKSLILGEPSEDFETPGIYSAFLRFDRRGLGQITGMTYYWAHRLVIRWIDNPQAEMQLITLINRICAAIDDDPTLGARVTRGVSRMDSGDAGFATINKTKYRICDFTSITVDKTNFRSGS